MSQTEELRAELDRLKIKWWEDAWDSSHRTIFDGANGVRYCAYEFCGVLFLETKLPVTVEQAISVTVGERNHDGLPIGLTISNDGNLLNWMGENYVRQDAATVGAGTCHKTLLYDDIMDGEKDYGCSECGRMWFTSHGTYPNRRYRYCPECGRRIEVSE